LAARLLHETGLPVLVSNDVDCMAQAELELDKTITLDNFLYLGFTEGVKASLVLNGEFYTGPFGNAGSIGHTTVAPDGPLCTCGNRGCLEAVASVRSTHQAFEHHLLLEAEPTRRLLDIAQIENRMERFHAICEAAASGEKVSREIVTQTLYYLSIAIANLVNIFQVKLVIIGGLLSQLPIPLRDELDRSVRGRLVDLLRDNLTIRYARDDRAYTAAIGAAHRFVNKYLSTFVDREGILG
jgi:glucokinase